MEFKTLKRIYPKYILNLLYYKVYYDLLRREYYKNIYDRDKSEYKSLIHDVVDEFIETLKSHNAIISGSFVLAEFVDTYIPNDIDIYVSRPNHKKLIDDLSNSPYIDKIYDESHYYNDVKTDVLNKYINRIYSVNKNNRNCNDDKNKSFMMDVIVINDSIELVDFINNHFDFSFCKVWFDGDYIYTYQSINELKNQVGYIDTYTGGSIEGLRSYLQFLRSEKNHGLHIQNLVNIRRRLLKYLYRGFRIINLTEDELITILTYDSRILHEIADADDEKDEELRNQLNDPSFLNRID